MMMDQNFLYNPEEIQMIQNTLQNLVRNVNNQQFIVQQLRTEWPDKIEQIKSNVQQNFSNAFKHIRLDEKILNKSVEMKWIKLYIKDMGIHMYIDNDYFTYLVYYQPTKNIDFMVQIREQILKTEMQDNAADIDKVLQEYGFNFLEGSLNNPDHDNIEIYEEVKQIEKYKKYILKYQQFSLMISKIKQIQMNHYKSQYNQLIKEIVNNSQFKGDEKSELYKELNYISLESIQYDNFIIEKQYLKQYNFTKIKDNGVLTSNYNVYKKVKATIIVNKVLTSIFVVNYFKHYKEIQNMIEKIQNQNKNFEVMYLRIANPLSKNSDDTELSLLYEALKFIRKNKINFQISHDLYQLIYKEQVSEFRIWLTNNYNIEQQNIKIIQQKLEMITGKQIKPQDFCKQIIGLDVVKKFKELNPKNELIQILESAQIEEHIKNKGNTSIVQNKNKEIDQLILKIDSNNYVTFGDKEYPNTQLFQTNVSPMPAQAAQFYLSHINKNNLALFKNFLEMQSKGIAQVMEKLKAK